jgi:hypothetical protein
MSPSASSRAAKAATALLVAGVVVSQLGAADAVACTACACGSAAALPIGSEIPWAGRVRTGVVVNSASTVNEDALGVVTAKAVDVAGVVLWAPAPAVVVDAIVPLGLRELGHDGVVEGRGVGLGDLAAGARVVWRDRAFAPSLVLSSRLGGRAPSTTWLTRADGSARPRALQPGLGEATVDVQLQAVLMASSPITVALAIDAAAPLASLRDSVRSGPTVAGRGFALWRVDRRASVRGGVAVSAIGDDVKNTSADAFTDGKTNDVGRVTAFVEAGVGVDLSDDVMVAAVAAVPVSWMGDLRDGSRTSLSLMIDW